MRILLLTGIFPSPVHPQRGTFNLEMARGLAANHDVRVVCPLAWTDALRAANRLPLIRALEERVSGITTHYPLFYYPPKLLRRTYAQCLWRSVRSTVVRILSDFPADLVMGYWAHPDGTVAVQIARGLGVPGVIMVGGSDILLFTKSAMRRRAIAQALRSADAVITVGDHLKQAVVALGVHPDTVHTLRRGVDTARFNPGSQSGARRRLGVEQSARVVVWVGRMVPVKGLDVLIRAAADLRARGVEFRLYLVGDGPLRARLEHQAARLELGSQVEFRGACSHAVTADWFRAADVTVLPSHSEGVPNVLLESTACGTRFVATDVGGVSSLAEPDVDILVPPGNPEKLSVAIEQSLSLHVPAQRSKPAISTALSTAKLVGTLEAVAGGAVACA